MNIIEMNAENVKKLKVVRIRPDGTMVVIGGNNEQGKSSVIDAIIAGLGGGKYIPGEAVRVGQKKGFVDLDLGDFRVKRTFTHGGGGALTVTAKDGTKVSSPQQMLDSLLGAISFDPLAFARGRPTEQLQWLKRICGVDVDAIDAEYKVVYEQRTAANRAVKDLTASIASRESVDGAPEQEVSVADITAELQAAIATNDAAKEKVAAAAYAERELRDTTRALDDSMIVAKARAVTAKERIAAAEKALAELKQMESAAAQAAADKVVQYKQLVERKTIDLETAKTNAGLAETVDIGPIQERIAQAGEVNRRYHAAQRTRELITELNAASAKVEQMERVLRKIQESREQMVTAAAMPVDGLAFGVDGVIYKGLPFDQASHAEQLRVSVAIGLSENPKLNVMFIKDGSLLDDKNLTLISEMAEAKGAQVWIERVGTGAEMSVIMEDGEARVPDVQE